MRRSQMVIVTVPRSRRVLSRIFTLRRAASASGVGRVAGLIGAREERRSVRREVVVGAAVVVGVHIKGVEQANARAAESPISRNG